MVWSSENLHHGNLGLLECSCAAACFTYGGHLQKVVECLQGDAVCPIHVHHNARRNRLQFRGEESQ